MALPSAEERQKLLTAVAAAGKTAYDDARASGQSITQATAAANVAAKATTKKSTTTKQTTKKPATTTTATTKATATPETLKAPAQEVATTQPAVVTDVAVVTVGNQQYEIPQSMTAIAQKITDVPLVAQFATLEYVTPAQAEATVKITDLPPEQMANVAIVAVQQWGADPQAVYEDITGAKIPEGVDFSKVLKDLQTQVLKDVSLTNPERLTTVADVVAAVPGYVSLAVAAQLSSPETIAGAAPEYGTTEPVTTPETPTQPSIIDTIIDFIQDLINPTTPTTPTTPPETQPPGTSVIDETTVPPSVTESALSELFSPKRLLVLGIIGLVTGIWLVGS